MCSTHHHSVSYEQSSRHRKRNPVLRPMRTYSFVPVQRSASTEIIRTQKSRIKESKENTRPHGCRFCSNTRRTSAVTLHRGDVKICDKDAPVDSGTVFLLRSAQDGIGCGPWKYQGTKLTPENFWGLIQNGDVVTTSKRGSYYPLERLQLIFSTE